MVTMVMVVTMVVMVVMVVMMVVMVVMMVTVTSPDIIQCYVSSHVSSSLAGFSSLTFIITLQRVDS